MPTARRHRQRTPHYDRRRRVVTLGASELYTSMILGTNPVAFWPGNEVVGNALEIVNGLHLTDTNTVTSAAGIVYPLARQYTAGAFERHVRPGDDALLSTGDVDFTVATWVRFDILGAAVRGILGKWIAAALGREYCLIYNNAVNRIVFYVSNDGTATANVAANTLGVPAINTWYLIMVWHDSVANTINIEVNDGGIDSLPHATGVFDSASPFAIGSQGTVASYMTARCGPTMFWKSVPGGGGVLTAAQRTMIYTTR